MAHLADNPVTYVHRAHELGAVTISFPGVLVYEVNVSRFGGLVKER